MSQKTYEYDFLVFIGRFQPFHNGHKAVIDQALRQARRVIVLIGSANRQPSIRNPFTFDDRVDMIDDVYRDEFNQERLIVMPLDDLTYHEEEWVEQVQRVVKDATWAYEDGETPKIGLIGRNKDNTSYYLKLFPQWDSVDVVAPETAFINATDIRNILFYKDNANYFNCPDPVNKYLVEWKSTSAAARILDEHEWCEKYKEPWKNTPYPVTFNTVDSVVIQSGHVLLVERKAKPGQGLLALPGGFLNQDETLIQGAIRELKEETRLDVPKGVLYGCMKGSKTFDEIHRDPRGRFITHAFLFHLPPNHTLPKIKAGSDARKALWVPLVDIEPTKLFTDHAFIIRALTANL